MTESGHACGSGMSSQAATRIATSKMTKTKIHQPRLALWNCVWFQRRWEESRGDQFASWGAATYYFEVGPDGRPVRQVEDWTAWTITADEFSEAWSH